MQELPLERRECGDAVLRVTETGWPIALQVGADLVRAAGLQAHRSSVAVLEGLLDLEVGDGLARVVGVGRHRSVRTRRSRPSGASIVPRPRRRAPLDQREVLPLDLARARSAPSARRRPASVRASTSRPDVSRSRRWTTPGRIGSSPPATRPASAWTSVPCRVARCAGCTTTPGGLSTTSRCVVLVDDRERRRRDVGACSCGGGCADDLDHLAAGQREALRRATRRRRSPRPPSISLLRRRPRPGVAARKTSRRSPAAQADDVKPVGHARRSLQHVEQRQHAERDGDVGDVERRPQPGA